MACADPAETPRLDQAAAAAAAAAVSAAAALSGAGGEDEVSEAAVARRGAEVERCRLTVSKPVLKASMISALEATI
jgi:hypothetical protein